MQHSDGTLGTRLPPEMSPPGKETIAPKPVALTSGAQCESGSVVLDAPPGLEAAFLRPFFTFADAVQWIPDAA
jgi:hypothetical protein